jgi:hypothetical protein
MRQNDEHINGRLGGATGSHTMIQGKFTSVGWFEWI